MSFLLSNMNIAEFLNERCHLVVLLKLNYVPTAERASTLKSDRFCYARFAECVKTRDHTCGFGHHLKTDQTV